jgi:creatinine amidohydrolase/Fe(II)-dependent formamide hydrolase-like protein
MGGGNCANNPYNCADAVSPIPAPNTVWLEEMTWMEVRDAMKAGKKTVIIATGGIEPNGPWIALGKHNYVLHQNCEAIARKMGNALCAPIVKFVPEGNPETANGHMASPGTLSMRETTFRAILTDLVVSLKTHGFEQVFLIGDSGGNQSGQRGVADSLNTLWGAKPLVAHIQEYYDYAGVAEYMKGKGLVDGASDNLHDDPVISLNIFADDPKAIRLDERIKAGRRRSMACRWLTRRRTPRWRRRSSSSVRRPPSRRSTRPSRTRARCRRPSVDARATDAPHARDGGAPRVVGGNSERSDG